MVRPFVFATRLLEEWLSLHRICKFKTTEPVLLLRAYMDEWEHFFELAIFLPMRFGVSRLSRLRI